MQYIIILVFIQITQLLANQRSKQSNDLCKWKNPQGVQYDISSLQKSSQWQVKEDLTGMGVFNMVYIFNLCSGSALTCNNTPAAIYEALEVYGEMTDNCDIIAKSMQPEYSNIDNDVKKGLQIVYTGGDTCFSDFGSDLGSSPNQQQRKATFHLECSNHNEDNFIVDSSDPCNTLFKMKTQVGCKGGLSSHYSNLNRLFQIIIIFGLYFGLGYFINKKQKGLEGVEALPHLEFWKELPQLTLEGIRFSINISTKYYQKFVDKLKRNNGQDSSDGYSTI